MNPAIVQIVFAVGSLLFIGGTGLMGWTANKTWDMAEKIGSIDSRLSRIETDLAMVSASAVRIEGAVTTQGENISKRLDALAGRMTDQETDPLGMLAKLGIKAERGYVAALIEGRMTIFPTNDDALKFLEVEGWQRYQLSPVLAGYRQGPR